MANEKPYIDPFLDPDFHIDTRVDPPDYTDKTGPEAQFTLEDVDPTSDPQEPEVVEPAPAPAPAKDEPEFIDYGGGMSATIEKKKGVWTATLTIGDGIQPQVFKGETKEQMYQNLMKGQIEATKKIREQNKKLKLGVQPEAAPTVSPSQPTVRELTEDDVFDIKVKLEANPDLAFETWFQKKTGMSVTQLAELAQDGRIARADLDSEAEAKAFMAAHPDYVVCGENATALYGWMTRTFLRKELTPENAAALVQELKLSGHHTADNLARAYDDLVDGGLLILKQPEVVQTEPEVVAPVAPTAPPQGSRIAKPRGPKLPAAYGLPASTSAPASPTAQGVSDDDLESLPMEQLEKLHYEAIRRARQNRR